MGYAIGGFLLGVLFMSSAYSAVTALLTEAGAVRPNYAGRPVPVAAGFIFVLGNLAVMGLLQLLGSVLGWPDWFLPVGVTAGREGGVWLVPALFMFGSFAFGLLGLADDLLGSRAAGGFGGHFRLLLKEGKLTTGAVKALAGGVVALWLAAPGALGWTLAAVGRGVGALAVWRAVGQLVADGLVIALTANLLNLLDLRPGRAVKAFGVLLVLAIALGAARARFAFLAPLAGMVLTYAPHDLGAQVMMGDTGSNVLGVALGVMVVWTWAPPARLAWLVALLAIHAYTERRSLSETIDRVAWLRYLDRAGRAAEHREGQ